MVQNLEFDVYLLGSDINVYGMARSFHEEFGITSLALSASGLAPTKYSKIVEVQTHENFDHEETFIQVLRDFASKHKDSKKKYLLVACGDGYALLASKYREELSEFFEVPYIDYALYRQLENKPDFYNICEQYNLPYPKTKSLSFGTSVHGALAYLTEVYKKENRLIPLEKFLSIFDFNLKKESLSSQDFQDLLSHGHQVLADYYENYKDEFNGRCFTEHDFKSYNVRMDDIPLTGKIDKIEFLSASKVNVVDYKTGKPDSKYQELSPEGDYFRQLVFYKLLCSEAKGFPHEVVSGTIDFIEKNNKNLYVRKNYSLTDDNVTKLKSQIIEVFSKIKSLDFTPSPKCEDKDHLHYLFDKYFK